MSISRSRTLCGLPNELKLNIAEFLYESSPRRRGAYGGISGIILIPLSCTSRDWRNITLPYIFQEFNFFQVTNEELAGFLKAMASKYGHYCRSLGFRLHPDISAPDLMRSDEMTSIAKGPSSGWRRWEVKRNALLFAILHFMPNVEGADINVEDFTWHDDYPQCGLLDAYELLTDSLAERALTTIEIDFGCIYASQTESVELVRKLLLGQQETLERVCLYGDIVPITGVDVLDTLKGLPRLRVLRLVTVCSFADLSGRTWTGPLQRLYVHPADEEDTAQDDDVSFAFASLPNTLRHLELSRWMFTDLFDPLLSPLPSNLTLLESLTLSCTVTRTVLSYFRTSKLVTLHVEYRFDVSALSRVLDDRTAFPCLKTLFVSYPAGSWDAGTPAIKATRELLSNACRARDVTITFGR